MIASLITAGATILANHFNNKRILRNYYENRHYNTPAAQMQRYKQAGLNPHLIYTQQNESDPPPFTQAVDLSSLGNIPSELSTYQDIKKSKQEVDNLDKQNQQLDEQIRGIILDNALKKIDLNWKDLKSQKEIDYLDKQIQDYEKQWKLINEQINKLVAETANVSRATEQMDYDTFLSIVDKILKSEEIKNVARSLDIREQELQERRREFDEGNWKHYFDLFVDGFTDGNREEIIKSVGAAVRDFLLIHKTEYKDFKGKKGGSF